MSKKMTFEQMCVALVTGLADRAEAKGYERERAFIVRGGSDMDHEVTRLENLIKKVLKLAPKPPPVTIASFTVSAVDANKIFAEVDKSCLTKDAKKAIYAAIAAGKKAK